MIIIDAIIAFTVPAAMTWRRAIDKRKEISKLFGVPMVKDGYRAIRRNLKKDAKGLFDEFYNHIDLRIQSQLNNQRRTINKNIVKIINNDVKHMIQDQVSALEQKIPNMDSFKETLKDELDFLVEDFEKKIPTQANFDELVSYLKGVISATGVQTKMEKSIQREGMVQLLREKYPDKYKNYQTLMVGKELKGIGQSEIDQFLKIQAMMIKRDMEQNGSSKENLQIRPEGQTSDIQTAPDAKEKGNGQTEEMGGLDPETKAKEFIENIIGKSTLKNIEKIRGNENGHKTETNPPDEKA